MVTRRSAMPVFVAVLLALGALGGLATTPQPTWAADGRTDTATSVYTLDPAHGRIDVVVDYKLVNTSLNVTRSYPCIQYYNDPYYGPVPYGTTCTQTSKPYFYGTSVYVEADATNIKVTANAGVVSFKPAKPDQFYRRLDLTFTKVYSKQTRTFHLTYSLPGGKPRSNTYTRALSAYANFCAISHGYDSGVVRIRVPAAYTVDLTGSPMTSSVSGTQRVYSSGTISSPANWWACVEGVNSSGYATTQLAGPDGRPVILEAWPEDATWAKAVEDDLTADVPQLTKLIGQPMAGSAPLVIKETVTGAEYAGFYDTYTNTITVDEDFAQPGLVGHELAHVWFNERLFRDTWLSEGYAEWAGRKVETGTDPCTRPTAPTGSTPMLSDWRYLNPKSSDAEREAVNYQYDASCYLITQVAAAAGDAGMTAAMVALLDGRDPYAADRSASAAVPPTAVTWRQWLDAVDELALYPADASPNLVPGLLVEFGVTSASTELRERSDARAAYHDLQREVAGWVVPEGVRAPLRAWQFGESRIAIDAAEAAWTITGTTDRTLAGVDARNGPVARAWAAAATTDDLDAATAMAQQQLDAATEVADTITLADAPRDLVQQIGLIGSTVPSLDPAVDAVRMVHPDEAHRVSASVRDVLDGARSAGELRIVVGGLLLSGTLLLLVVYLIRRGRRTGAIGAAAAVSPMPGTEGFIGPVLAWSASGVTSQATEVTSPATGVTSPATEPTSRVVEPTSPAAEQSPIAPDLLPPPPPA